MFERQGQCNSLKGVGSRGRSPQADPHSGRWTGRADHCFAWADLRCDLPEGSLWTRGLVDSWIVSFCDRWNATHPWNHSAHYHRRVLRQLPAAPERVLDVGCGAGDRVRRLAVRRSWVHGVDQNGTVIQRARARIIRPWRRSSAMCARSSTDKYRDDVEPGRHPMPVRLL